MRETMFDAHSQQQDVMTPGLARHGQSTMIAEFGSRGNGFLQNLARSAVGGHYRQADFVDMFPARS
jgi:hypothetical protein